MLGDDLMLIGTFINGYKSYNKTFYIPITESWKDKYSVYIGNNGVGKSAIFEALDVFFNNREWNISKGATREEVYISTVFLIEKHSFIERIKNEKYYNTNELEENNQLLSILEKISQFIWNDAENYFQGATRRGYIKRFFQTVENLKKSVDQTNYYLVIMGVKPNGKTTLSPFHNNIRSIFQEDEFEKNIDKIRKLLFDYYAYVYIPVEQNADEVLKIEAKQMQTLMSKDVLEEIDNALTTKFEINGRSKTFLSFINEYLNTFMKGINSSIQSIDENYNYGTEMFSKKNLTASDIRDKILEAYFSKRSLRHNNREIHQLSSGEQRRALIDIAYAFLSNKSQTDKKIILAIDEPEASLNIANCFSQFSRLERLANQFGNQLLVTTHWYGFLPTTKKGNLYHLSKDESNNLTISEFNFFNFLDNRRNFPNDIELKSMFDLATSILSFLKRNEESKWIICEGSDDKIYLESILPKEIGFNILPVGGCGNVVKLYNLLVTPLNIEKSEKKYISGRILCLIDTDEYKMNYIGISYNDSPIQLRRLQICKENGKYKVRLINPEKQGQLYEKTEIEDCLDPQIYYQAIKEVIEEIGDENIKEVFYHFTFDESSQTSRISGDNSILIPIDGTYYKRKHELIEFLSKPDTKYNIAKKYSKICDNSKVEHQLTYEILDYFNCR